MPNQLDTDAEIEIGASAHFRVAIQPAEYVELRIPTLHEVKRIVTECRVSRRGWDFPHIRRDAENISPGKTYFQGSSSFEEHVEEWRLYQSGQFLFKAIIREAYIEHKYKPITLASGKISGVISFGNWVWNITEFCEFAYRLGSRLTLDRGLNIVIKLVGIKNFAVGAWREEKLNVEGSLCLTDTIEITRRLGSSSISTDYDSVAISMFIELMSHFDIKVGEEMVAKQQDELLRMRMGGDKPRKSLQYNEREIV